MLINRRRIVKSANVRNSEREVESAVIPTNMICPITLEIGPITGVILSGIVTVCSFSETNCRARYTSMSQPNSTNTNPMPTPELLRTRSTPGAPFIATSTGVTTCVSISSGAMPLASRKTVTCGRFRSGRTSTGKLIMVNTPYTSTSAAKATTSRRFWRENFMSAFNIVFLFRSVSTSTF